MSDALIGNKYELASDILYKEIPIKLILQQCTKTAHGNGEVASKNNTTAQLTCYPVMRNSIYSSSINTLDISELSKKEHSEIRSLH